MNLTENFKVKLARPELKRTQWQDDADGSQKEEEKWPARVHEGTAQDTSEHMGVWCSARLRNVAAIGKSEPQFLVCHSG